MKTKTKNSNKPELKVSSVIAELLSHAIQMPVGGR
jgi:hypothetical protein